MRSNNTKPVALHSEAETSAQLFHDWFDPIEMGVRAHVRGLAKAGNARVRRGLIQLAWRFLMFQKDSALVRWYRTRTEGPSGARKTTMIVALARKLPIALWRLVTTGEVPDGVELRPAA
jgi:transposase